ncbi:MAG TPA: hypothetical protein VGD56_18240 [Gemmatirosa sp.]
MQPGPFRQGQLRDLVAIAEALGRCGPGEVDAVARACTADPGGGELSDTLALARALRTGAEVVDRPGVQRIAAQRYRAALGTSYGGEAVARLAS